ncbi:MAG: SMI1/KNR4 family protein [Candidatus Thiodiazotropha sp. (ex Rostrolucina anterorostrata)]|nr:SMI1/KNR4 family protein [Candidatus Thiodiazotropha sp. (ex Rostrolucina anterorostrata)]
MVEIYYEKDEIVPISIGEVCDLESRIKYKLPDDYRNHLLAYNGAKLCIKGHSGHPMQRLTWNIAKKPPGADVVSLLHQPMVLIRDWNSDKYLEDQYRDIRFLLKDIPYRIQRNCIPIWNDPGGSFFLLGTAGSISGKILYADRSYHEYDETGERPIFSNVAFVANSFTNFVEMIEPEPDDWEAWEAAGMPHLPLESDSKP